MRSHRIKPKREPTIALINIVFLMLVFFMVAGTLTQPIDDDVTLVKTRELEGRAPPDTVVIHADGRLNYRGEDVASIETHIADLLAEERAVLRLLPDRNLPATRLVAYANAARSAGAERIMIVTQRDLQ